MGKIEILENKYSEDYKKDFEGCKKNQHHKLYEVGDLATMPLPPGQHQGMLRIQLLHMALLTGHIKVNLADRQRLGSGMVQRVRLDRGSHCPVNECRAEGRCHEWAVLTVSTVNHVVGTDKEAKRAYVELFYHKDSQKLGKKRRKIKTLRGHKVVNTDKDIGDFDWCAFECVTHDLKLARKLCGYLETMENLQRRVYEQLKMENLQRRVYEQLKMENLQRRVYDRLKNARSQERPMVVIVSHPHGGPKKISVGRTTRDRETMKEVRDRQAWCRHWYDAPTCSASSGGPVFIAGQPVCGFGYWFGHPHNHAGTDGDNHSSIGVDHNL